MSTEVKNYKLLEIPENFKKVCQSYEAEHVYANLMPKCGTMYTRAAMAQAKIWPEHAPHAHLLHRGDHYVASNSNLVLGMKRNRGWFRNQNKLESYKNFNRAVPPGYGKPLPCKKFWFTIVRNPFNLLVTYYTFGWPWDKWELDRSPRGKAKGGRIVKKVYSSFDYFIKSYCDPEF